MARKNKNIIETVRAFWQDKIASGNQFAGPFTEANSGMRDNRPYHTWYSNGVFIGYDNSIWVYFRTPRDVQTEWGRTSEEAAENQRFLSDICDSIGKNLEVASERTRRDERVKFHLLQVEEDLTSIEGYEGIPPAHKNFLDRIQQGRFVRPAWYSYFGVQLRANNIFYDTYGAKEKFNRWFEAISHPAELNFNVFEEDYHFIYDICVNKNRMEPLDFNENSDDFRRMTAFFGVGDDYFNKPPDIRSTPFQVPAHNESIITPSHGEISFRIVAPLEGTQPFLAPPARSTTQFANAYFDPSSQLILSSIRGEIRAPKVAKNILDNKMSVAEDKAMSKTRQSTSFQERKEILSRASNTQLAQEAALQGHSFLDNVEMVVAVRVGEDHNNKSGEYFNQMLSYFGLTSRNLTQRQHDALCSTLPTASRAIMPYSRANIKRNLNTNQFFSGVLAMSGLLRSTKPYGQGGIFLGLSDSQYDYKEIYMPHGNTGRVSDRSNLIPPIMLVTGSTGSGKALPLDTPLTLYSGGAIQMGDVVTGTVLVGPDGKPTTVTSVTPTQYDHSCYTVEIADGRHHTADANHQWIVNDAITRLAVQRGVSTFQYFLISSTIDSIVASLMTLSEETKTDDSLCTIGEITDIVNHVIPPSVLDYFLPSVPAALSLMGVTDKTPETLSSALRLLALRLRRVLVAPDPDNTADMARIPINFRYTTAEIQAMLSQGREPGIFATQPVTYEPRQQPIFDQELPPDAEQITDNVRYASVGDRIRAVNHLLKTNRHLAVTYRTKTITIASVSTSLKRDLVSLLRSLGIVVKWRDEKGPLTFTPTWDIAAPDGTIVPGANPHQGKTSLIASITPTQSVPVKCITVDNHSHAYLIDETFTPTSNTVQMTMMAIQSAMMGLPVFYINPKPKSSLAPIFEYYDATVINMDDEYLQEQPGMLDPMYFIEDRKQVARILADIIRSGMSHRKNDPGLSTEEYDLLLINLQRNAEDPRNTCSHDIIMGNRKFADECPPIENTKVLDFVRNKLIVSPLWKSFISERQEGDSLIRNEIQKGKPILIEWSDAMPMPNTSNEEKWTEANMEAVTSVNLIFLYASAVIGKNNTGGGLYIDEASYLKTSEEAMNLLINAGRTYREKFIDIVLGTQNLTDFTSGSTYELSSYCQRFLMMRIDESEKENLKLFYKFSGINPSPDMTSYIHHAGINPKRPGSLPKAILVDSQVDWRGGIQCGPWPETELALATQKDKLKRTKRPELNLDDTAMMRMASRDPNSVAAKILRENELMDDVADAGENGGS